MGAVERSKASLRIGGDDLDPDEITALWPSSLAWPSSM